MTQAADAVRELAATQVPDLPSSSRSSAEVQVVSAVEPKSETLDQAVKAVPSSILTPLASV